MPNAPSYAAPKYVALVPEELDVRVFRHSVDSVDGPVSCWSYVTDGLRRYGQKDVVFTVRRLPDESDDAIPRDPLDLFKLLFRRARGGRFVDVGGYSRFARAGGFLGNHGAVGMTYLPALPLRGVNYPDKPLAAVLITADEVEVVRAQGAYRLLSLLGYRSNYFPYPPWSDRARGGLLTPKDVKNSLLGHLPLVFAPGLMTRRQNGLVYLHWSNEKGPDDFAKRLADMPKGPFALMTDADPDAKARLVWKPGMSVETIAVDNRPDATMTGGFLAVFPTSSDEHAVVCEDGFAARLQPATWRKVCRALVDGETMTLPASNAGLGLSVGLPGHDEPVRQVSTQFFLPDESVSERIRTEELAAFERRVGNVVEDHFADLKPGAGQALTLFCAVRPGPRARFWVDCQPRKLVNGGLKLLQRRLDGLKPTQVSAPVAWAMRFNVWGGTGDPRDFSAIPEDWAGAVADPKKPVLSDEVLDRVWPPS